MTDTNKLLPESIMQFAYKAIDYAADNIRQTNDSFTPFAFFLTQDGETSLIRFASHDPDEVSTMVQTEIDKVSDTLASYAIAQDAYTSFGGVKRDSIIIEVGCAASARAIQLVQQYSSEPEYQEHGNVKLVGELPLRIKPH